MGWFLDCVVELIPSQILSNCVLPFPQTLGTGRLEYFKYCPVSGSLRKSERGDFAHALQEQNGLEYFNLGSVTKSLWRQNIKNPEDGLLVDQYR